MEALGIDIGGSGIKGAPVDTRTGSLLAERHRLKTPKGSKPAAVVQTVTELTRHFGWQGPVGVGFPGIIRDRRRILSAANLADAWIGLDAKAEFDRATALPFTITNDADAAGMAEMRFGGGRECAGVVVLLTLGTGIGSALFVDGTLVPNTELGHLELKGKAAERYAASSVRERDKLSWGKWARRLDRYLERICFYFSPDLIILDGGVSKQHAQFIPRLQVQCRVQPAELRNEAGIVGAALAALA